MSCTQISARAHRKLVVTDTLILAPMDCGVQEHTDKKKEWSYNDTLPHNLSVPHTDKRSRSSTKIMSEVDNEERGPTEDESRLEVMRRCGAGKPMDRNTVVTEMGTKGV